MEEQLTCKESENIIELVDLTRVFEDGMVAVDKVNLKVKKGEFVTFWGRRVAERPLRSA